MSNPALVDLTPYLMGDPVTRCVRAPTERERIEAYKSEPIPRTPKGPPIGCDERDFRLDLIEQERQWRAGRMEIAREFRATWSKFSTEEPEMQMRKRRSTVTTGDTYLVSHAREDAAPLIEQVAARHGLTLATIFDQDRRPHVVVARQEAIAAVHRQFPAWSYPVLGKVFRRDHSTVMHALRRGGAYVPSKPPSQPQTIHAAAAE